MKTELLQAAVLLERKEKMCEFPTEQHLHIQSSEIKTRRDRIFTAKIHLFKARNLLFMYIEKKQVKCFVNALSEFYLKYAKYLHKA